MSDFNQAVQNTLKWEGGYSCDPADPGGDTNFGIEQADMPNVRIKDITQAQAIQYYRENYWKPLYSEISSQAVANKLFDMGVNDGVGTAVKLLQEVLPVFPDGVFGPNTLLEVNKQGDRLLEPYKAKLIEHYQAVVKAKPETIKFLAGWIRRANS